MTPDINKVLAEVMGWELEHSDECDEPQWYDTKKCEYTFFKYDWNPKDNIAQAIQVADRLVGDGKMLGWTLHNLNSQSKYGAVLHLSACKVLDVTSKECPATALSMAIYEFVTERKKK